MLTISGVSAAGKEVVVKVGWNSKDFRVTSGTDGKFEVQVPTPKAGGPYTITIDDGEPLFLQNVLVGEVWLCSGQSNMELPVGGK